MLTPRLSTVTIARLSPGLCRRHRHALWPYRRGDGLDSPAKELACKVYSSGRRAQRAFRMGVGMAAAAQPGPDDELGPVDFLAIEFPGGRLTSPGFEQLLSLADQGVVDILDMEFITKDADGRSKKVDVWEFAVPQGVDLSAWAGASSGLLDDSDVGEISAAMQPGSVAVVVIYENRWALGLADAWRRDGARLIASGGLSADEIVAALDASESS